MIERTRIALIGAGGKMGRRITKNLKDLPGYQVAYVEVSHRNREQLLEYGVTATDLNEAVANAGCVVLAVPDRAIAAVAQEVVPRLRSGALIVLLDPAAAHAGVVPIRDDLGYFVTHPCHPPVFNDEVTPEAKQDWFGGVHAKHDIVCALHHGTESHFAQGEALATAMFAPVMRSYRITVEQMALLEPALAETFVATLITAMKEALDEVVDMGVPADAAKAFLMGHIRVPLAIVFGYADFPFSDGAMQAIEEGYAKVFRPDWKRAVFDRDALIESVRRIAGA